MSAARRLRVAAAVVGTAALCAPVGWALPGVAGPAAGATPAPPLAGATLAWGADGEGQLGDASLQEATLTPTPVTVAGVTFSAVAMGGLDAVGLTTTGSLYTWGSGIFGQFGTGSAAEDSTVPLAVAGPPGVRFTAIAAGSTHDLALAATGAVYAWGNDLYGQLGVGSFTWSPVPVEVHTPPGVSFTAVAAGGDDSYALSATGAVYAWGANFFGQLGDATTTASSTPVAVDIPPGVVVTAIAGGDGHALAVASDGSVYAWGDNLAGQLGDGTTVSSPTPVSVDLPANGAVAQVAAGSADSVALTTSGKVLTWGAGVLGQLGDGGTTDSSTPVSPTLPSGPTFAAIAAGASSVYAVTAQGTAWAWGADYFGQLGDGTTSTTGQLIPEQLTLYHVPLGTVAAGIFSGPDASAAALITPKSQTLSLSDVPAQTYGDPAVPVQAAATSGLRVSLSATGACTVSSTRVFITAAGTCTITAAQAGDLQYYPAPPVTTSFVVAPAPLTVTPTDVTAAAGGPLPSFTYAVTGFKDGDTSSVLSGSPACTTSATPGSAPGQYPITCAQGTLEAPNYTIVSGPPGVLTLVLVDDGYAVIGADGSVWTEGPSTGTTTASWGSMAGQPLAAAVVGGAFTPLHDGYWLVASDGGIFAFGDATFYGSMGGHHLNEPVVGMAVTPTGAGYWEVASDGGIFAFGDAGFFGSTGNLTLNKPVVGMVPAPDGQGYWLVASDGGVFAFGDATFYGSIGGDPPSDPVVGMAAVSGGEGYWVATANGNIYSYGSATYEGSLRYLDLAEPVVSIAAGPDGGGYWLAAATGGVFAFGTAAYYGRVATPPAPVVGIT